MIDNRRTVKAPEKSNFSQTCSLLSQYLKKKRSFGDLSHGMACNLGNRENSETLRQKATVLNLFSNMETNESMDFLPEHSMFCPSVCEEDVPKETDFRPKAPEPETAQMTIFYAGKVLVFDDFPAEKARDIMLLGSKGSSRNRSSFTSTAGSGKLNSGDVVGQHMSIARKASLHRFLNRRRDRIAAKAPYQVINSTESPD